MFPYMQATDKAMQQRVAVALAWLGKEADLRLCFVDRKGLDVLLELLTDQRRDAASHKEAAGRAYLPLICILSLQSFLWLCLRCKSWLRQHCTMLLVTVQNYPAHAISIVKSIPCPDIGLGLSLPHAPFWIQLFSASPCFENNCAMQPLCLSLPRRFLQQQPLIAHPQSRLHMCTWEKSMSTTRHCLM